MTYTTDQIDAINTQVSALNANINTAEALLISTGALTATSGQVLWDPASKRLYYTGVKPQQRLLEATIAIKKASDASVTALIAQAVTSANQALGIKS